MEKSGILNAEKYVGEDVILLGSSKKYKTIKWSGNSLYCWRQ